MELIRKITSRDNDQVKHARRVRDGRVGGKIFLEGLRLVDEAARARTRIDSVFVTSEVLDELGEAVGITYEDNEPLHSGEKVEERDRKRWELDPASSEDYNDRVNREGE